MPRKSLFLVSFLLASSFIWYYTIRALFIDLTASFPLNESILINGTYYAAIIVSSICSAILAGRIRRIKVLLYSMVLGCIASSMPFLFTGTDVGNLSVMALLAGISFGVGMPSCLALFADSTDFGNRGKISGITFLATNLGAFALAFLGGGALTILALSLALRIAGLCTTLSLKPTQHNVESTKNTSFRQIFWNRTFLLYALPWLIFVLVDRFEVAYFENFFEKSLFDTMTVVEPGVGTIFVFLGGLLADRIGRKRILICGFVALGIGYASIGLAPYVDAARYLYIFVDGIAWGIFMVLYLLILWGDLSVPGENAERYYTIGSLPFFLTDLLILLSGSYVRGIPGASAYAIFSLASFFLFLAVLPLMYAPETLPEKRIKERELKGYVEKAKKTKEKYT